MLQDEEETITNQFQKPRVLKSAHVSAQSLQTKFFTKRFLVAELLQYYGRYGANSGPQLVAHLLSHSGRYRDSQQCQQSGD